MLRALKEVQRIYGNYWLAVPPVVGSTGRTAISSADIGISILAVAAVGVATVAAGLNTVAPADSDELYSW